MDDLTSFGLFDEFLPARRCASAVLAMTLPMSVPSRCSVKTAEQIHLNCTGIRISSKIRVLFCGTLSKTTDLENLTTAR